MRPSSHTGGTSKLSALEYLLLAHGLLEGAGRQSRIT
jgi:hypothetical protein